MKIGKIEIIGKTDVGRQRDHNEDNFASEKQLGLIVLADGMGGHNAGEVASEMAVEKIVSSIKENFASPEIPEEISDEEIVCFMLEAINTANHAIFETAATQPQCAGMGTTIVVALFRNNCITIAHVGDSRLYRWRKGELEQLTVDHSLYQEMIQGGYMSEEEADKSLNKNMITRALGISIDVEIDIQQQNVEAGDLLLLCSDGLTDLVNDTEIQQVITAEGGDLNLATEKLVNMANEHGGTDNITVVMASVAPVFEKNEVAS